MVKEEKLRNGNWRQQTIPIIKEIMKHSLGKEAKTQIILKKKGFRRDWLFLKYSLLNKIFF